MINTSLFEMMINRYNELSYTHNYIYGFFFQNTVYMIKTTAEIMPYILKLDKTSRGAGYSLRFCPTNAQKTFLLTKGAQVLCSKESFETSVKESKYNKGEIFEKMVTEFYGQEWTKDNVPFTEDGDLTTNGIAYQIKFEKATFTNEKTLARMEKSLQVSKKLLTNKVKFAIM